jgi:hypothetical protein
MTDVKTFKKGTYSKGSQNKMKRQTLNSFIKQKIKYWSLIFVKKKFNI